MTPSLSLLQQIDMARYVLHPVRIARDPDGLALQIRCGALLPLASLLFLLDPVTQKFVQQDALRLSQLLRRQSERVTIETQSIVRGRIDWASTIKAETSGLETFVCRTAQSHYDLLENQYFFFCLNKIAKSLQQVGLDDHPILWGEEEKALQASVLTVRSQWGRTQQELSGIKVTIPGSLTPAHDHAVLASKMKEYRVLPEIRRRFRQYLQTPDTSFWLEALTELQLFDREIVHRHSELRRGEGFG